MKRIALTFAAAVSLNVFAATECDEHLYHRVTQATARLLRNQVLQVENVRRMAQSATPFPPVGENVPDPRAVAAHHFYRENLPALSSEEWQRIRSELRAVLQTQDGIHAVEQQAALETAEVPGLFPQRSMPTFEQRILDWKQTPDGRTFALYDYDLMDKFQIFDLANPVEPKLSRPKGKNRFAAMTLAADGEPVLWQAARADKPKQGVHYPYRLRGWRIGSGEVPAVDLLTTSGEVVYHAGFANGIQVIAFNGAEVYGVGESVVECGRVSGMEILKHATDAEGFPLVVFRKSKGGTGIIRVARFNGKTWSFVDGGAIELSGMNARTVSAAGLRDGRVVVAWYEAAAMHYRIGGGVTVDLFRDQGFVSASQIFETEERRIMIAATTEGAGVDLIIREIGNPDIDFRRSIKLSGSFRVFERRGRFYAVALGYGTVDLFEPRIGGGPVFSLPLTLIKDRFSLVKMPGDRVLLLGSQIASETKVFSLFERPR